MTLNPTNISIIRRLLGGKNTKPLRSILSKLDATDLASLFSHLNKREKNQYTEALIAMDLASTVLLELPEQQLKQILLQLDNALFGVLLNYSGADDASYFLSCFEADKVEEMLALLEPKRQERLRLLMSYPPGSAGRLMNTLFFCLPASLSCEEATLKLRSYAQEDSIYYIYCTDSEKRLVGVISLRELVTAPANVLLKDVNSRKLISISPYTAEEEVAQIIEKLGFVSLPVVDDQMRMVGIVTVDEILDVIQEQATSDIYATAGLQEDDRVYSSVKKSIKNRLPWMAFNLILAAYVSSVVSLFEKTLNEAIILATLNNIVAGMGGNTAIQTLTVFTRGIARGDFQFTTYKKAIIKEASVGLFNGIITGVLAGILVFFWKGSVLVGFVICIAMILNSLIASSVGSVVPLLLKKWNFDPAAGSGVIVTMITDSFGFFCFLGIGTLVLRHFGHL